MVNIEHCNGKIEAYAEAKELLSMITTKDKITEAQLEIIIKHFNNQIELETRCINCSLMLMESYEIGGCKDGGTL